MFNSYHVYLLNVMDAKKDFLQTSCITVGRRRKLKPNYGEGELTYGLTVELFKVRLKDKKERVKQGVGGILQRVTCLRSRIGMLDAWRTWP